MQHVLVAAGERFAHAVAGDERPLAILVARAEELEMLDIQLPAQRPAIRK